MSLNPTVEAVTDRIRERSRAGRDAYLARCRAVVSGRRRPGTGPDRRPVRRGCVHGCDR